MNLNFVMAGMMLTLFVLFLAEGVCAMLRKERWSHAGLFRSHRHAALRFCRRLRSGGERLFNDSRREELPEGAKEIAH